MTFLELWFGYAILGVLIFSVLFIWAVRARQFSQLDRARHIALRTQHIESVETEPSRLDRFTWIALALITLTLLSITLLIAIRISH